MQTEEQICTRLSAVYYRETNIVNNVLKYHDFHDKLVIRYLSIIIY